ncbi:nuclear GTPase SLIP-GC-like [Podargus strigoides]
MDLQMSILGVPSAHALDKVSRATHLLGRPTRDRVSRDHVPHRLAQSPGCCAMVAGTGGRGQQGEPPTSPPAPHGRRGAAAPRLSPMGGGGFPRVGDTRSFTDCEQGPLGRRGFVGGEREGGTGSAHLTPASGAVPAAHSPAAGRPGCGKPRRRNRGMIRPGELSTLHHAMNRSVRGAIRQAVTTHLFESHKHTGTKIRPGKKDGKTQGKNEGKEMYSGEGNGNVEACSAIRAAAKNMAVLSSPLQEDLTVLPLPAATTFCSAHSAGPEQRNALCPPQGTARLALSCRDGRAQTGKARVPKGGTCGEERTGEVTPSDQRRGTSQKKTCRRDPTPEDGEKEALRNYKKMQNGLKGVLDRSAEKLSQFLSQHSLPETGQGISYLRDRLTGLKPDILMDPIYIGLFGSTGAGKSTLLNAIIDKNFFLPVSGSKSCTSCVVQVNTSHSKLYEAKIHLLTDEEWKDELKDLVALAELDEDEDSSERYEAVLKISAVYGEEAETKSYEELCRMKPIVHIPSSRCITLREANAEELSAKLSPYIRIQSIHRGANARTSEEESGTRLWPLIKNVEVTIPRLQVVPEGVVFVDIPGMGDFNSKRDAMWRENINKCSVIWVVNSIERIQGDRTHEMLLREGMKAFQCGMCRDISLVVTKSDEMDLSEYQRESNNSDINKHDAILERNATVKQEKTKILKKNLGKKLPSDAEALHKDDLVYTVSSREYWKGHTLSKDETEIPKLREYAQTFYVAQKKNKLMDHVREALVIFSLVQSLRSNQDAQHPPVTGRQPSDLLLRRVADLEGDIEKCFVPIEQPLEDGVVQAKKLYDKCIHKIFNRVHGNRGFHKTLKAVCLKKGVYASPTFCRIDINDSLAQPIYEKIDMSFGNIFRIQMGTRSTLKACLDVFKDAMKQQLRTAMTGCQMADKEDKLKFLEQETEFITGETEKLILQKKAEIYQSLTVSIQNDLLPCYAEAASQRGAHACKRMQTILSEGIETELGKGMFERAQASMRSHFQDLKVGIVRKMKKDFSDMLSLVFCPWNQLSSVLPDLQNEFSFIHTLQEDLNSASDA